MKNFCMLSVLTSASILLVTWSLSCQLSFFVFVFCWTEWQCQLLLDQLFYCEWAFWNYSWKLFCTHIEEGLTDTHIVHLEFFFFELFFFKCVGEGFNPLYGVGISPRHIKYFFEYPLNFLCLYSIIAWWKFGWRSKITYFDCILGAVTPGTLSVSFVTIEPYPFRIIF